ncbi:MAG: hypothetical protein CMH83_22670 [Nocardioides sp.]|nr:hypothetical protein [Nocardioides sp.]
MLYVLDLLGVAVFAASGALVAVRNRLDVVGVVVLATATGLGGGLIRDVLIGDVPPASLRDWWYLAVPIVVGLLVFRWHPAVGRREPLITTADAAGLGLFCVSGALKATEAGLGPLPAALIGVITGVGGGVVRDLLADRVPLVLSDGELYAIPALAGASVAVLGSELGLANAVVAGPAAALTIGWRLLAVRRGWHAPGPHR